MDGASKCELIAQVPGGVGDTCTKYSTSSQVRISWRCRIIPCPAFASRGQMGCVASGRAGCAWGPSVHPMPPDIEAWGGTFVTQPPTAIGPSSHRTALEVEVSSRQARRGSLSSCHLTGH